MMIWNIADSLFDHTFFLFPNCNNQFDESLPTKPVSIHNYL